MFNIIDFLNFDKKIENLNILHNSYNQVIYNPSFVRVSKKLNSQKMASVQKTGSHTTRYQPYKRSSGRQQKFRDGILQLYGKRCLICKHDQVEAAHIVDYSVVNDGVYRAQYDPYNGIPLCHNHHSLFDKRKIYIQPWNPEFYARDNYLDDTFMVGCDDYATVLVQFSSELNVEPTTIQVHRNAYMYLKWREHELINPILANHTLDKIKKIARIMFELTYEQDELMITTI